MHWKPTNHTGEPPTNPSWSPWLLSIFICYFITCLYISQRWQPVQLNGTVAKWNVMDRHLGPGEKWVGCGPPQSILWKKHSWGGDRQFPPCNGANIKKLKNLSLLQTRILPHYWNRFCCQTYWLIHPSRRPRKIELWHLEAFAPLIWLW